MLDGERLTAVVVARKGSRRVPKKYLREIAGVPMIVRKVLQLRAVTRIDEVLVGTDDDEMGARLEALGDPLVRHYRRPDRLCDERSATPNDMIRDMCGQCQAGVIIWAHPTNPLCGAAEYDAALDCYRAPGYWDSVVGVTRLQTHCWFDGMPTNHDPWADVHAVAADLQPMHVQNGSIFIRSREAMLRDGRFVGDCPKLFEMTPIAGWDIDEEWQLRAAQELVRYLTPCDP